MGDLFWNKVAGVLIGGVLVVIVIMELGHILIPSHAAARSLLMPRMYHAHDS